MDSKFGGGGGKGGGGETDKLNIDSIIARLLEGWINRTKDRDSFRSKKCRGVEIFASNSISCPHPPIFQLDSSLSFFFPFLFIPPGGGGKHYV